MYHEMINMFQRLLINLNFGPTIICNCNHPQIELPYCSRSTVYSLKTLIRKLDDGCKLVLLKLLIDKVKSERCFKTRFMLKSKVFRNI